jgi:hypothetical protein
MKKYLMTGMAAVLFCGAFTSCSHDDITSAEDISKAQAEQITKTYETAFLKYVGGEIDKNQTWGFSSVASARTRNANTEKNLWGDPNDKYNLQVPPALTNGQKERVQKYFQSHTPLQWRDPGLTKFYIQQVYKGGSKEIYGGLTTERYTMANANYNNGAYETIVGSDHMDYLMVGLKSDGVTPNEHVNDFNDGDWNNGNTIWVLDEGASTNDWKDYFVDGVTHADQITLMTDANTQRIGYGNTTGSSAPHMFACALVYPEEIDAWADPLGIGEKVTDTKWNRSFVGLDFESNDPYYYVDGAKVPAKIGDVYNSVNYAWDGSNFIPFDDTFKNKTLKEVFNLTEEVYLLQDRTDQYAGTPSNLSSQDALQRQFSKADFAAKDITITNSDEWVLDLSVIKGKIDDKCLPVKGQGLVKWILDADKRGRDYIYSDWIVTLTEAKTQGTTPTPPTPTDADLRIMAEDLSAEDDTDFDFNDIVFDVYFDKNNTGQTKIVVQAAGGTLPLRIKTGDNTWQEVHELWSDVTGVTTGTMINTGAEARYGFPRGADNRGSREVTLYYSVNSNEAAKNITIEVQKTTAAGLTWVEMRAEQAEPAAKFATDPDNQWLSERTSIKSAIPSFVQWVQGNIPALNWK